MNNLIIKNKNKFKIFIVNIIFIFIINLFSNTKLIKLIEYYWKKCLWLFIENFY